METDEVKRVNRSHRLLGVGAQVASDIDILEHEYTIASLQNQKLREILLQLVNTSKEMGTTINDKVAAAMNILEPNEVLSDDKNNSGIHNSTVKRLSSNPMSCTMDGDVEMNIVQPEAELSDEFSQFIVSSKSKGGKNEERVGKHRRSLSGSSLPSNQVDQKKKLKPTYWAKRSSVSKVKTSIKPSWTSTLRGKDAVVMAFSPEHETERYNMIAFIENFMKLLPDEKPIECYQGCCTFTKHGDGSFFPSQGEPVCGMWINNEIMESHHHFLSEEEKQEHIELYHSNQCSILSPGGEVVKTLFDSLPEDVQLKIFGYLDLPSILIAGQVSKNWHRLSLHSNIWIKIHLSQWGLFETNDYQEAENTSWVELVRTRYLLEENWNSGNCHSSVLQGHSGWVTCVDMHNNRLVSSSYDGTVRIWNTQTGHTLQTLGPSDGASPVWCTQCKTNNVVAGYSDSVIRQWNGTTGQCVKQYEGHEGGVKCLRVSCCFFWIKWNSIIVIDIFI